MINTDPMIRMAMSRAIANMKHRPRLEYPDDPVGFMREVLGWEPWSKQQEISQSLVNNRKVFVKKCHASGGTALLARIALWFLYSFTPAVVITTARVERQLKNQLWREIRTSYEAARRPLEGKLFQEMRLDRGPSHYMLGFATDNPDNVPGFHSANLLLIKDEAAGIQDAVGDALESALAGGFVRQIEMSQPLYSTGRFYDAFNRNAPQYEGGLFTISAFDTPNFTGEAEIPALATPSWQEECLSLWGEDSALYKIRVLAEFPPLGARQLISPEWIDHMREVPYLDAAPGPRVLGVDVGGLGRGLTVIYPRQGNRFFTPFRLAHEDPMTVAGYLVRLNEKWRPECIAIDITGLGLGTYSRCRELRLPVSALQVGGEPWNKRDYTNRGSELYAKVAGHLRDGDFAGMVDEDTKRDLIQAQGLIQSDGRLRVDKFGESEDSPDSGDAFVYTEAALDALSNREYSAEGDRI